MPSALGLSDTYRDGSYAATHPTWHSERSEWKAEQICKLLDKANLRPKSVLDIGCGVGKCLHYVAKRYDCMPASLGIEPSPDVVPMVPEDSVRIECKTVAEVDGHFELAMMLDVFEHVDDYLGFLRAAHGVADWYAFHIPLDIYAMRILAGRLTSPRKAHGHLHYFTLETALATIRDTGFEVVRWDFTPSGFEGAKRSPYSPRNLLRRFGCWISPKLVSRTFGGLSLAVLAKPKSGN